MAACLVYGLGAGTRSNFGMLVQPLVTATGLSYDRIRLVMAVTQLASGLVGPLAGAMALRTSDRTALVTGALMVAGGPLAARGARARGGPAVAGTGPAHRDHADAVLLHGRRAARAGP